MVSAKIWARSGRTAALAIGLLAGAIAGCEAPATSSSEEKVTVKGVVTVDGKPVTKGSITFDPANVNRKMASASSGTIGPDGSYSVSTLVGRNAVTFDLPGLATPKNKLNYSRLFYEVKSGENTFDAALPVR